MLIIVYFSLLFLNLFAVITCRSPCPAFFSYGFDNRTGELYGRIRIPNPPSDMNVQIRVNLSVAAVLPMKYEGKIQLAKSKHESVKTIETGQPLLYKISFPLQRPLPLLTGISVNGIQFCVGPPANARIVTNILLEHTLYPSGVDRGFNPATNSPDNHPTPQKHTTNPGDLENLNNFDEKYPIEFQLNSYQDENCGKTSEINRWPWLVAIFVPRINVEYQCSGNLITDSHILTAAHCMTVNGYEIPPNLLLISLARYRLDDWREDYGITREVKESIIHPEYTKGRVHGDLAILVLRKTVEMSPTINLVCLWPETIGLEKIVGKMGYVVGWGKDEDGSQHLGGPREERVPIVSQEECFRSNLKSIRSGPYTSNKTFCAGWRNGTGPCNGDTGSGLMIHDQTSDRYYLRGILSFPVLDEKIRFCDLSSYAVFADAAKSLNWIYAQISN